MNLIASACIATMPEGTARVDEHDAGLRRGPRQLGNIRDLRVEDAGLEQKPPRCDPTHASLECGREVDARSVGTDCSPRYWIGVPLGSAAYAS